MVENVEGGTWAVNGLNKVSFDKIELVKVASDWDVIRFWGSVGLWVKSEDAVEEII